MKMNMFQVQFKKETGLDTVVIVADECNFGDDFVRFSDYNEAKDRYTHIAAYNKDVVAGIIERPDKIKSG